MKKFIFFSVFALMSIVIQAQPRIYAIAKEVATDMKLQAFAELNAQVKPLIEFQAGHGHVSDSALFSDSTVYGSYYNSSTDTLVVTQLKAVLGHGIGVDTVTLQISWASTMLAAQPTNLNTAALPVTSTTTGTTDVAFANSKIPPGAWVWCKTPAVVSKRKPIFLSVALSGYRK